MIIATIGITRLFTREFTTAANATPITNATASSTMLPLSRKSLKSFSITSPFAHGQSDAESISGNRGDYNRTVLGEVLTAIVTPFRADGSVDLDAFRSLARFLLDNGSDGIVVAGTTGEAPTLTDDERLELVAAAVETVGDRGTVVAGTGTYSTAHAIHLTQRAHELGVDGILVVTPYYNKPPQRGIVAHVEAVAAAEPATITRLAEIENVHAVKQAKPSIEAARHVVECGLDLYAGDDDLILPFLEVG